MEYWFLKPRIFIEGDIMEERKYVVWGTGDITKELRVKYNDLKIVFLLIMTKKKEERFNMGGEYGISLR